jgi:hypothetical protein
MKEKEYEQVQKLGAKTATTSLSDYGRRVLVQKPVSVRYRNQSLDDFLADMLVLRRELGAIGTNFNQSVHHLHTLHIAPEIQHLILINEQDKTHLFRLIEALSNKVNDPYILWSQL